MIGQTPTAIANPIASPRRKNSGPSKSPTMRRAGDRRSTFLTPAQRARAAWSDMIVSVDDGPEAEGPQSRGRAASTWSMTKSSRARRRAGRRPGRSARGRATRASGRQGPLSALPPTIPADRDDPGAPRMLSSRAIAARTPGWARIGPTETMGFEGAIRTSAGGIDGRGGLRRRRRAAPIPRKRTSRASGSCRRAVRCILEVEPAVGRPDLASGPRGRSSAGSPPGRRGTPGARDRPPSAVRPPEPRGPDDVRRQVLVAEPEPASSRHTVRASAADSIVSPRGPSPSSGFVGPASVYMTVCGRAYEQAVALVSSPVLTTTVSARRCLPEGPRRASPRRRRLRDDDALPGAGSPRPRYGDAGEPLGHLRHPVDISRSYGAGRRAMPS